MYTTEPQGCHPEMKVYPQSFSQATNPSQEAAPVWVTTLCGNSIMRNTTRDRRGQSTGEHSRAVCSTFRENNAVSPWRLIVARSRGVDFAVGHYWELQIMTKVIMLRDCTQWKQRKIARMYLVPRPVTVAPESYMLRRLTCGEKIYYQYSAVKSDRRRLTRSIGADNHLYSAFIKVRLKL